MKKLCVIGDPIAHSKSPLLHSTMLKALGLDGTYIYGRERVPGDETAAWMVQAVAEGFVGFNATMPHKERLLPYMDELDEDAVLYGAVNTVCIKDGRVYGHNTDGRGFLSALTDGGVAVEGARITLLGAGGAAKAVALKLVQQGAAEVAVCTRTSDRAQALCAHAPDVLRAMDFSPDTLLRRMAGTDLLVNCTNLGMEGTESQFEDLGFLAALPAGAVVCDLIYAPAETALLRSAQVLGHRTMNGLGMLIWQAIFALEHFTDRKIDGHAMADLLKKSL